jgi:hypothetical protein
MSKTIQARLDDATAEKCDQLQKSHGWTDSEIVRRGIELLASTTPAPKKRKFRGVGKYNSGIPDLATNKKHLEGFGQ